MKRSDGGLFTLTCWCLLLLFGWPASLHAQTFVNRTYEAGLEAVWQGHGIGGADYDSDGDLDIYIASRLKHDPFNPRSWNRLYRNNGDGTFTDVALQAGVRVDFLPDLPSKIFGNKFSVSWADYDRDGDPDLLLTHVGPEVLFRNNGDGTFTDVADEAGLNSAELDELETAGATWWDYDLDGWLDLYLSSWNGPNRFYRNRGDGTFEDIGSATGLNDEDRTWMSMSWDVNGDALPDLYLANDFGPNTLYLNRGNGQFEDASEEWGLADQGESMGLALGDVSGDGYPDLYVTNNAVREGASLLNTFFLGASEGPLQDAAASYGIANTNWAWGTEFFDGDLDGDLDLFVVNGALLERNTPNRYFHNMTLEEGILRWMDVSSSSQADGRAESHGLLVFDLEEDGDPDLLITNWDEPLYLLVNSSVKGNWLKVTLEGTVSNRDGVGSVITLSTSEGQQYRWYNGVDFLGQSIQPVMFGLGDDASYQAIEVTWPGGMTERWQGGAASRTVHLVQGTGLPVGTSTEKDYMGGASISVHPNPGAGNITLQLLTRSTGAAANTHQPRAVEWAVYDMVGRLRWTGRSRNDVIGLGAGSLASGVYVATAMDPVNGQRWSETFVIRTP